MKYTSKSKITVSDPRGAEQFDVYKHPNYDMVLVEELHSGSTIEIEPEAAEELAKAIKNIADVVKLSQLKMH